MRFRPRSSASAAATAGARARKQGKILAATSADGVVHAMVVFLWDDHHVYYFHSSRKKNLAHAGAVSLLLWSGIELAHSRGLWFDFDAGLAKVSRYKFLVSFGGEIANRSYALHSDLSGATWYSKDLQSDGA